MMSDLATLCYGKYQRNVALAASMEEHLAEDDGWSIVARFYAALQLMNAYLIDKGNVHLDVTAAAHEHRKSAMAKCPDLRDAPKTYRALKELSEDIRYNPEYELTERDREESRRLLARIIAIVEPKLKKA